MEKINSILVIVERSNSDLSLLKKAIGLARQFGAWIELFTCDAVQSVDFKRAYDTAGVEKEWLACIMKGGDYLETLREAAGAPDVRILVDATADPRLIEAIARKVDACQADLVMKSAGRAHPTRRFTLDPTDWELMRACPATLMLVRGKEWQTKTRFAAMVDMSEEEMAEAALIAQTADYVTRHCGGLLDIVYSDPNGSGPGHERRVAALIGLARKYANEMGRVQVLSGDPDDTLPAFASQRGYDMIVLGAMSHRKSLITLVGRMTGRFAEALHCDFLFVRPAPQLIAVGQGSSTPAGRIGSVSKDSQADA